ncbi:MAG: class I SAM-dependent methyltransferase [Chloroflexi bacterium]|nr:class I SAM-dependent methyltransferase [Chloroflexota bacterium]
MNLKRWLQFNLWYYREPPWDTGISPPELSDFMQRHRPGRALDLGCGTGSNVITLAQHGWEVTGVDFALPAIRRARHKVKSAGVRADLRVGDVTRLHGVAGPFDLILDIGCFHGLTAAGRAAYRNNVARLLVPGGYLLLYAHMKVAQDTPGHGLTEQDIRVFMPPLTLVQREAGIDGQRQSVWLTFTL